ncbi:hypothetical protein HXX76_013271 [Chlamydomonas incerta]|uniref:FAD-binding domain-containing protein n=1 Tax=Chlamydomonas incerta TaxID=51695 RepID=A0A835SF58_CHLIN|nr:hypothetical protein HXX76_013271 [Chlamydomonas incerta]|eukprot:KAG2426083.1 hypothetical protein HXX76_013271 [Chlamydomonas incerta]
MHTDVAIVGGGPGGLAAAAALSRVLDPSVRIKVFEAARGYSEAGAGVGMHINGLMACEAIHPSIAHTLYDKACYSLCSYQYDDVTGQRNAGGTIAVDRMGQLEATGHCQALMYWNDVRESLYEHLPDPGMVEFGWRAAGCQAIDGAEQELMSGAGASAADGAAAAELPWAQQPYRYELRMARQRAGGFVGGGGAAALAAADADAKDNDGKEEEGKGREGAAPSEELLVRAKVVIGADGYFSRIRRELLGGTPPVFSGVVMWRGSFTAEELSSGAVPLPPAAFGAGASDRAASHRWTPAGAGLAPGQGRVLLLFLAQGGDGIGAWYLQNSVKAVQEAGVEFPPAGAAGGVGGLSGSAALARALAANGHLPPDVAALLAATAPERVTEHGLYVQPLDSVQQGSWTRGHVVLIGDAAHAAPPDGQGANLAIEDAVVLADVARRHGGVLGPQVFAEWEALRQPRVKAILGDTKYPFTERMIAVRASSFAQLWAPGDPGLPTSLPADPADGSSSRGNGGGSSSSSGSSSEQSPSMEALRAWSRRTTKAIVERRLAEVAARGAVEQAGEGGAQGPAQAPAPAVVAAGARDDGGGR